LDKRWFKFQLHTPSSSPLPFQAYWVSRFPKTLELVEAMAKKETRTTEEDRISDMSDDVLCHILSFLTTKEAIVTSLLSKRWTLLWCMLPSLHVHCSKPIIQHHAHVQTFLALHRAPKIKTFHLQCHSHEVCCSHHTEEWVSEVVAKKVENLNISLCNSHESMLSLPTLFTCSTLVTLNINGPFYLSIPSSVHLPNLKTMELRVNSCIPHSNFCKLVSESAALELFYMGPMLLGNCFQEVKAVHKCGRVEVFYSNWVCDLFIESERDYDFNISDVMALRTWPNIVRVKAYVTVHFDDIDFVENILEGLRNVEFLYMKYFRLWLKPSLHLLPFNNLVELRLLLNREDSMFDDFPRKCPKLKVLEFNIMDSPLDISERYRYHVHHGVRERDLSIVHYLPLMSP